VNEKVTVEERQKRKESATAAIEKERKKEREREREDRRETLAPRSLFLRDVEQIFKA